MSEFINYAEKIASISPEQVKTLVERQLESTDFTLPDLELTKQGVYCKGRNNKAFDQKAHAHMTFNYSSKYKTNIIWVYVVSYIDGEIAKANSFDVLKNGAQIHVKSQEQLAQEQAARLARAKIQEDKDTKERAAKARRAKEIYANCIPTTTHTYFSKKRVTLGGIQKEWPVKTHESDRTDDNTDMAVIPLIKWVNGSLAITGIQRIYSDGVKKCLGEMAGSFYPLGDLKNPTEVYVCGGLATALTVYHAKKQEGILVIHAVSDDNVPNKNNEPRVFAALVEKYPHLYGNSKITFVSDLDIYQTKRGVIPNKGFKTASELQKQYPLSLVAYQPIVDDDWYHNAKPTDFNDVFCLFQDLGESSKSTCEFFSLYLDAGLTRHEFSEVFRVQNDKIIEPDHAMIARIQASNRAIDQVENGQRDDMIATILADDQRKNANQNNLDLIKKQEEQRRQQWLDMLSPYSPTQKALIHRAVEICPEAGYGYISGCKLLSIWQNKPSKDIGVVKTALKERDYETFAFKGIDYTKDEFTPIPLRKKGTNENPKENPVDHLKISVRYTANRTLKQYAIWLESEKQPIYTTRWLPSPTFQSEINQCKLSQKDLIRLNSFATRARKSKGKVALDIDKYIPITIPNDGTVVAYNTPTGSGKTELGKAIASHCKENGKAFVTVAPIRSLVSNSANRMQISLYSILAENGGFTQEIIDNYGVATTPHSLIKLQFIDIDTVFLDEICQLRKSFISSPMMSNSPAKNLAVLGMIIKKAKRVVVADAFMRDEDLEWVAKLRDCDVQDIVTYASYKPKKGYVQHMHVSKYSQLAEIKSHVKSGGYAYIACSGSDFATKLVSKLTKWGVNRDKILLATGETRKLENSESTENPVTDFICNPQENIDKYQVVIASPVINSGLSIPEFQGRKPRKIYGFFRNEISTASDAFQMLQRYRGDDLEFHVHVDFKTRTAYHQKELFDSYLRAEHKHEGTFSWESAKEWQYEIEKYNEHAFEIARLLTEEQNNFMQELVELAILQDVELKASTVDEAEIQCVKEDVKAATETYINDTALALDRAGVIYEADYERLTNLKDRDLTQQETNEIKAYKLRKVYEVTEITPDLLKLDNNGKTQAKLKKLAFATHELHRAQLKCQIQEWKDIRNRNISLFEQRKNPLLFADSYHWLFTRVKAATGLVISFENKVTKGTHNVPFRAFSGNKCISPEINEIFDRINTDQQFKREIEAFTGRIIPKNFDKSMRWFTYLLDCCDHKLSYISQTDMHERFGLDGSLHGDKYYFLEPNFKSATDEKNQALMLKALNNLLIESVARYEEKLKYLE